MGSDVPEYSGCGPTGQRVVVSQPNQPAFDAFVAALPGGSWTRVGLQVIDPFTGNITQTFVRYLQWPLHGWWTLPLPYQDPQIPRNNSFIGVPPWFGLGQGWVNNR